ncbi:hypothetical protein GCM10008090_00560 [Arenicella chitinivorans]|uniref:BLUF domain-containing protein n=2 Tax=Arenicella chitinivorans TaxID=1329800 RepID=A0A918VG52_9GAMM|nr:hypothetical protein GCM10008090_00560 [Arenicella chitinivorans]
MLTYRGGYYLGVLEGSTTKLDELLVKLNCDKRHENFTVLVDTVARKRYFSDWHMKLAESLSLDAGFTKFMADQSNQVAQLTAGQLTLLNQFYDVSEIAADHKASYRDRTLKLIRWPDFSVINQSPELVELCALLTNRPQRYQDLLALNQVSSSEKLDQYLDKFDSLGLLKTVTPQAESGVAPLEKSALRFIYKMKRFLGATQGSRI